MKTTQTLKRKMGQFEVHQRTSDCMFNATALLEQWNDSKKNEKLMKDFLRTIVGTYVKSRSSIEKGVLTKNGRTKDKVWMNKDDLTLFAEWVDPELCKLLGLDNVLVKKIRNEFSFGEDIVNNLFSEYKILPQFPVLNGKYRIDWYIPDLKLAIEFDERHHSSKICDDYSRQKEIEKELGCKFIRYTE